MLKWSHTAASQAHGGREEKASAGEKQILLNNCWWGEHTVALALTRSHNSRSPYLLTSSVIAFHQHKSLYPSVITFGSSASRLRHKAEVLLGSDQKWSSGTCECLNYNVKFYPLASFSWLCTLTSHYSFAVQVLHSPQTLCFPHLSVPWCSLLSILLLLCFPPFPPQSDLWFCKHPHPLCQKLHNLRSFWLCSLIPKIFTENHFSQCVCRSDPSCCLSPAHALSVSRLSLARQTAAWLQCKGKACTLTHFSSCIFHPSAHSSLAHTSLQVCMKN